MSLFHVKWVHEKVCSQKKLVSKGRLINVFLWLVLTETGVIVICYSQTKQGSLIRKEVEED